MMVLLRRGLIEIHGSDEANMIGRYFGPFSLHGGSAAMNSLVSDLRIFSRGAANLFAFSGGRPHWMPEMAYTSGHARTDR